MIFVRSDQSLRFLFFLEKDVGLSQDDGSELGCPREGLRPSDSLRFSISLPWRITCFRMRCLPNPPYMTVPFDIPNALADGAGGTDPHNGGVFCDSLSERRVTMVCRIGIFAGIRFIV